MPRYAFALLLLAGCTMAPDRSPSLLPRPIEGRSDAEPPAVAPVSGPDAALDAQIARRGAAFDASANAFDQAVTAARPRIERGARAARGSEAWIDAQAAVSELGQGYADMEAAMADLEQLAVMRANALKPPYPALTARIAAAGAALDRQGTVLAALRTRIGD